MHCSKAAPSPCATLSIAWTRWAWATERIRLCGGGARSRVWAAIRADLCQRPVEVSDVNDAAPLGAAVLASVSAGLVGSVDEAARRLPGRITVTEPDPAKAAIYDRCLSPLPHAVRRACPPLRRLNGYDAMSKEMLDQSARRQAARSGRRRHVGPAAEAHHDFAPAWRRPLPRWSHRSPSASRSPSSWTRTRGRCWARRSSHPSPLPIRSRRSSCRATRIPTWTR